MISPAILRARRPPAASAPADVDHRRDCGARRRCAPRADRVASRRQRSTARRRSSSATRSPGSARPIHARDLHVEDRAHARPHRLRPVRIGAARPKRHAARAERLRRAQHRAHVPRITDTVQIHAQRPLGAVAQRCSYTPITLVPEPSVETAASAFSSTSVKSLPPSSRPPRDSPLRVPSGLARPRRPDPRPRPRTGRCAPARACSAGASRPSAVGFVGM